MRRLAMFLLLALMFSVEAFAQAPPESDTQRLLMEPGTPAALRAILLQKSAALSASDPATAGELLRYAGLSFERGGDLDSAIVCYRRAVAARGAVEDRLSFADALLARRGNEDVLEALDALERRPPAVQPTTGDIQALFEGMRGWAYHLAGRTDTALVLFDQNETLLSIRPEWRYRIAVARLAANDPKRAFKLLMPLAVLSRRQDRDVMARLNEIADALSFAPRLDGEIERGIQQRERGEAMTLERMQATRYRFLGDDAFPLAGSMITPAGRTRPIGAIVLVAPGDTIADYDTLSAALTRSGYAVMLLDVRGSGGSVGPSCPLPDRWSGREDLVETQCARDVSSAFRAMLRLAKTDSTRFVVVGVGTTAPIAVQAAGLDRRITALLLVSPRPASVERGTMRARLARRKIPVYFQSGPEDFDYFTVTERLYQSGNRGASRVAEARLVGHGVRQFYYDPAMVTRFTRWLDETMRPARPRAPRPTSPRKG